MLKDTSTESDGALSVCVHIVGGASVANSWDKMIITQKEDIFNDGRTFWGETLRIGEKPQASEWQYFTYFLKVWSVKAIMQCCGV